MALDLKVAELLSKRLVPLAAAAAIVAVDRTSTLGLDLFVVTGPLATAVAWAYAAILLAVAARPRLRVGHYVAVPMLIVAFGGRTAQFVELVADGRTDLIGSVGERALIVIALLAWHVAAVDRIAAGHHLHTAPAGRV